MTTAAAREGGDGGAREQADRIASLLDEVRATAGQPTWQRVEELVQRIVGLYGEGIERLLAIAAASGAPDDRLASLLCEDELVSSLLVLHGLHPVPTATRVERALDRVRGHPGSRGADVALVGIDADGVASLRLLGGRGGCASTRATLARAIEAAVQAAAPEVTRVALDDDGAEPLVQIDLHRSRAAARGREPR
jgi:Fe-S cluster biogenesis protein NfuA